VIASQRNGVLGISPTNRHRLATLALFAGVIVICLIAGEIAVRLILGNSIVLFPRSFTAAHYDGVTLRRLIPNSTFWHTSVDGSWEFRTNAQGFRDDEDYEYRKPAGQRRVLVLGDSHTQGFEARQSATFAKQLERRLRVKGMDAQVLNTGISGFGTAEELMFLEHEGMKYHPDAVVLAFFANDFDDSIKSDLFELENGRLIVRNTSYTPGVKAIAVMNAVPGAFWLGQHSYLFSLFVNTFWETAKEALRVTARKNLTTEYAVRVTEVNQYERELVVALLQRMKAVAHAANIPFVIVEIPSIAEGADDPMAWQPSVPDDLVPAVISSCDVYVPASSYLAGAQKGTVHVPHGHRHISEQTHAKIGEALDGILSETSPRFSIHTSFDKRTGSDIAGSASLLNLR
jgi:lysophospholipase L1-like esterase